MTISGTVLNLLKGKKARARRLALHGERSLKTEQPLFPKWRRRVDLKMQVEIVPGDRSSISAPSIPAARRCRSTSWKRAEDEVVCLVHGELLGGPREIPIF